MGVSAWHTHEFTADRLFVNMGRIKVVLYDDRADSPTYGLKNQIYSWRNQTGAGHHSSQSLAWRSQYY
jgi:dTDP-4-dehydrorhamnose 3,5-epimerase-like enzyme